MASAFASSSRPVSPPSGGYSRRSSIASSSASTSRAADPFANAASSWYHPTSPTSSTISGGSPRSFYSAAQASASEAGHRSVFRDGGHLSLHQVASNASTTYEDDIGDVTITQDHNISPQRSLSRDRKGKARQDSEEYSYSENVRFYAEHAGFDANEDDEDVTSESPEESQRIEANLRKWAEKEKLRRAKTRSRYMSPKKENHGTGSFTIDTGSAVTQLVRRVSTAGKRMSGSHPGSHHRTGSRKLRSMSSKDDIFGDNSRLVEIEEVELQPQNFPKSDAARHSVDSLSQGQPLSATSASFPERIQRAARTGSRFIEDLEDPQITSLAAGQPQPQTYAQLNSNPATPSASPTKPRGTPRSKRKPFLKLGDLRPSSLVSLTSTEAQSPRRPDPHRQSSGQSTPTLRSPMSSMMPKQYYEEPADDLGAHLVSPTYKPGDYARQYSLDEEDEDIESERTVGWLEWVFCCGCFGSGVRLDDHDEQAGRTFPE